MDNLLGDLADIIRATTSTTDHSSGLDSMLISNPPTSIAFHADHTTEFSSPTPINQQPTSRHDDDFGDPFSNTRDPLLGIGTELDGIGSSEATANQLIYSHDHHNTTCAAAHHMNNIIAGGGGGGLISAGGTSTTPQQPHKVARVVVEGHHRTNEISTPNSQNNRTNIFSRILQISPTANKLIPIPNSSLPVPAAAAAATASSGENTSIRSCTTTSTGASSTTLSPTATAAAVGFMPNNDTINNNPIGNCTPVLPAGIQISSPRNPGIKRRKSQAKKVVCIPAPAATNSRQGGEVVPSDLWAWRKYGQKPIKGSPYPRGYYRCSSSKGCSARKQVERSRTDPSMLVITYTSEHNHPWPTQRNALAGSTRGTAQSSSSSKNTTLSTSTKSSPEMNAANLVKQGIKDGIGDDVVNDSNNNEDIGPLDSCIRGTGFMMSSNITGELLNGGGGDHQYLVKEEIMVPGVNNNGGDRQQNMEEDNDDGNYLQQQEEGLQQQHLLLQLGGGDEVGIHDGSEYDDSYRPIMPAAEDNKCNYLPKQQQQEDLQDSFFADLGELESADDPLSLLFRGNHHQEGLIMRSSDTTNKAAAAGGGSLYNNNDADPFSGMFDWVAVHNNAADSNNSSHKQM